VVQVIGARDGLRVGAVVRLAAFDDVPSHSFVVHTVEEDCVTGVAQSGPLKGQYGEPALSMITEVLEP
jgi:hypothetical protein